MERNLLEREISSVLGGSVSYGESRKDQFFSGFFRNPLMSAVYAGKKVAGAMKANSKGAIRIKIGNVIFTIGKQEEQAALIDIVRNASRTLGDGYHVFIHSAGRTGGKGNHAPGYAIDIAIVAPDGRYYRLDHYKNVNGKDPLGFPMSPTGQQYGNNRNPMAFSMYERLAQAAREYQMQNYKDYNKMFRWGGYFHGGDSPMDLMHFDITPTGGGQVDKWKIGGKGMKFDKNEGGKYTLDEQYANFGMSSAGYVSPWGRKENAIPLPGELKTRLISSAVGLGKDGKEVGSDKDKEYVLDRINRILGTNQTKIVEAIKAYQTHIGIIKPDGRVDRGGGTERSLIEGNFHPIVIP